MSTSYLYFLLFLLSDDSTRGRILDTAAAILDVVLLIFFYFFLLLVALAWIAAVVALLYYKDKTVECAVIADLKTSTIMTIAFASHVTIHFGAIAGLVVDIVLFGSVGAISVPFFVYTSPLLLLCIRSVIFCFHKQREISVIEKIQDYLRDESSTELEQVHDFP